LGFHRRTAVLRAEDAARHRAAQPVGIAHRHHRLAEQQIIVFGEGDAGETLARSRPNLQQGHVAAGRGHEAIGLILPAIPEFHLHTRGAAHDVIVGEQMAFLVQNDPRAEAAELLAAGGGAPLVKLAQQVLVKIVVFDDGGRGDVDHAGHDPFDGHHHRVAAHVRLARPGRTGRPDSRQAQHQQPARASPGAPPF